MFLELQGVDNARELGGIPAADGRTVAPGRLIRTGLLADATERDVELLVDGMGLAVVMDLRTPEEGEKRPDAPALVERVRHEVVPILGMEQFGVTHEGGSLTGGLAFIRKVKNHPERIMMEVYEKMATDAAAIAGYRRFFEVLLESGGATALWHCSSGKDRAGIAAALLLTALGAPREAAMADYLATNGHLGTRSQGVRDTLAAYHLEERLASSIEVLSSADARFLGAALSAMERGWGSVEGYLADALGVDGAARAELRARYLA